MAIVGARELRAGFGPYPREESRIVESLTNSLLMAAPTLQISRPVVHVDPEVWGIAAGLVLQLEKRGRPVAIEPALVNLFGRALAPTGEEDAMITVAGRTTHERLARRPGNIVLGERRDVFLDAVRITRPAGTAD